MEVASAVFFCQVRSTGELFGGKTRFFVCGCGRWDALELVLVVTCGACIRWDKRWNWHCNEIMDNFEHGGLVVSLWFFRRCSTVGHCSFSSITDTLLWCLWSPDTNLAALRFTLSALSISFWRWGPTLHCCTPGQTSRLRSMQPPSIVLGSTIGFFAESLRCGSTSSWYCPRWYSGWGHCWWWHQDTLHDGPLGELCCTVHTVWT